jgi:hypothetical protein
MLEIVTDSFQMSTPQSYQHAEYAQGMDKEGREFALRFNQAVAAAGLPTAQVPLGKRLGVSGPMARAYKTGEKLPAMSTAIRIANILNVCVEWLLTGRGPMKPGEVAKDDVLDLSGVDTETKAAVRALLHAIGQPKAANNSH